MSDKIVPAAKVANALAKPPAEWIAQAEKTYAIAIAELGAALIQKCTAAELQSIHDFVLVIEKSSKNWKEKSKEMLMQHLIEFGQKVTKKGTLGLDLGNGRAQYARIRSTKHDATKVEQLLLHKGLDPDVWMDVTRSHSVNELKLANAVTQKLITDKEVEDCLPEKTYTLGKSVVLGEEGLKEPSDE